MAAPSAVMDSGLVAVCLIIRSREGPRFVFHYPPKPTLQTSNAEVLYGTELIEERDEQDEEIASDESDPEDDEFSLPSTFAKLNINSKSRGTSVKSSQVQQSLDWDDHFDTKKGEHIVPWEHLFEYPTTDLESILTPSRAYHKKKFELELDPLYFISYPIHIRDNGTWKKRKTKKTKKSKKVDGEEAHEAKLDPKANDNASEDGDDDGSMTMFNVVFVLSVSKQQADEKIVEVYEHVVKIFNKALKHAQAEGNYVWKESEAILSMKEKGKEDRRPMSLLWNEILIQSTLAASIRDVFVAISENKIASIQLAITPPLNLSLQIPAPSFLISLPTSSERALPGLLVTSANPFFNEDPGEKPQLNKHFALLLLDDEDKIISEIQTDSTELSVPLLECIRVCKPTQSFLQVAQANSVNLEDIMILSQHLLYWRKAIAIPPLHSRETYIVSPNCDTRKLPEASVAWKRAFPLAPSLPSFLASLSAAPRPYKTFAPSKNHRPTYLDMLAWLIRGGWVTQLQTFAWILVWPEIIYEVNYQLKSEAVEKSKRRASQSQSQPVSSDSATSNDESDREKKPHDPNVPLTTEEMAENARLARLVQKAAAEAASELSAFEKMPKPEASDHPSSNNAEHLKQYTPYIIKDPHKVSHEESLYIAAIGKRFKDAKLKDSWGKFVKYFNGADALEMVPLREGVKRKEIWGIFNGFQEWLLVCRHW